MCHIGNFAKEILNLKDKIGFFSVFVEHSHQSHAAGLCLLPVTMRNLTQKVELPPDISLTRKVWGSN